MTRTPTPSITLTALYNCLYDNCLYVIVSMFRGTDFRLLPEGTILQPDQPFVRYGSGMEKVVHVPDIEYSVHHDERQVFCNCSLVASNNFR